MKDEDSPVFTRLLSIFIFGFFKIVFIVNRLSSMAKYEIPSLRNIDKKFTVRECKRQMHNGLIELNYKRTNHPINFVDENRKE